MATITATATRTNDGWWAVEVPAAGTTQYTQGRTLAEAERMVRDLMAIMAEEMSDPALADATVSLQATGQVAETARTARHASKEAAQARQCARETQAGEVRDDPGHRTVPGLWPVNHRSPAGIQRIVPSQSIAHSLVWGKAGSPQSLRYDG